jgi:MFS family permease
MSTEATTVDRGGAQPSQAMRRMLIPLALAQFICSFAGSNMNVMINDISQDLNTTVQGVQAAITIFLLVMAALMIPGGKLSDRWGRKRCFVIGLRVYAVGAVLSAVSPSLGVLILGNSILEGVGTAMLIPPVYILTTLLYEDITSRARAFGAISGMGGIGAATGPLIGGVITTAISWRASFIFQALVIVVILYLTRALKDPLPADPSKRPDTFGAILSAAGLVLVVVGIQVAEESGWLTLGLVAAGLVFLALFYFHIRRKERKGEEPLLSTKLFRNRTSNLGLITQNAQWLLLIGTAFVVSAFLQVVRGYNAIQTGVIFTAATAGVLLSSLGAERFAKRRAQRTLVLAGFATAFVGVVVLLALAAGRPDVWAFAPGLFLIGFGCGLMLTPSVNIVQSSWPEAQQGEISGLSRAVSNLGSTFGTAIAGTVLVIAIDRGNHSYALAMIVLGVASLIGLGAALFLPRKLATSEVARPEEGKRAFT